MKSGFPKKTSFILALSVSLALLFAFQNCSQQQMNALKSGNLTFQQASLDENQAPVIFTNPPEQSRELNSTIIGKAELLKPAIGKKLKASLQYIAANTSGTATMPRSSTGANTWRLVSPDDGTDWTAGFFTGCLWQYHLWSGEYLSEARTFTNYLRNVRAPKRNPPVLNYLHGNLGFDMSTSYILKYDWDVGATDRGVTRDIIMRAAGDLQGIYNSNMKAVIDRGTWEVSGSDAYVPVDYIMILEPLFWAARNGGSADFKNIAINHARTILTNHIRTDGGTWHHVIFNQAGGVIKKKTHQGYSDDSTWSRGQAWAIYGLSYVYGETGLSEFRSGAMKVADYFIARLPADGVPPWDFQAPNSTLKDSSAAAIAASGLLHLSKLVNDKTLEDKYVQAAEKILLGLMTSTYMGGDMWESGGTVSPPSSPGLLLQGTGHYPNNSEINVSLIYGDYYFLEALNRYLRY